MGVRPHIVDGERVGFHAGDLRFDYRYSWRIHLCIGNPSTSIVYNKTLTAISLVCRSHDKRNPLPRSTSGWHLQDQRRNEQLEEAWLGQFLVTKKIKNKILSV